MRRRTQPALSRERVLRAALDLVDREGVEALTMRRLGRELGVEAMSLYGYVESKQDLIEGVVEQVFNEMPLITPSPGPWQEKLRIHAAAYREVLLRHPNTVRLVAGRPLLTEGTMAFVDSALAELCGIGLDVELADMVLSVVARYTIGHVAEEVGHAQRLDAGWVWPGREVDPERFPSLAALWRNGPPPQPDEVFSFGFDFILTGIERLLAERGLAGGQDQRAV